jgi:hypothetical protein
MSDEQLSMPEGMELRDIAPPASVWDLGDVLMLGASTALILLALASLMIGWIWWWRRPRFPVLPACPEEVLAQALENSRSRAGSISDREAAVHASIAIRAFLHRRYGLLASFATTGELAEGSGSDAYQLSASLAPLLECLDALDALRFRPGEIPDLELTVLLDKILHWLESNPGGQVDEQGNGSAAGGDGTPDSPYELAVATKHDPRGDLRKGQRATENVNSGAVE